METLENRTKKDVLEDLKRCEDNLMELFKQLNKETNKIEALNEELDRIEENNDEISNNNLNKMEPLNNDKKSIKHDGKNKKLQCTGQSFAQAQGKYTASEDKVLQNKAVARSIAIGKYNAWSMTSSWLKCKCRKKCNDEAYWCICSPIDDCY
ncbi:hypothetical protein Z968_10545 [Clostridium novyi A str. 4552]|uniref:Uncharacterized protein n=1 Tax=Clostridium novyi A str. 4552 TaxID=1444289 RepID=A0A0A0I5I2_CLONO|nr:hypothetical protein [Clostridium novyi]KGM94935.1 hypothetical protein Z968_10545 [Clostridium novyi A str. 4552]